LEKGDSFFIDILRIYLKQVTSL